MGARLILVWSGALVLAFALAVGFVRAFPREPDPLYGFLHAPEGCQMPCWMGIRPGETTVEDALSRLTHHEWGGRLFMNHYDADKQRGIIAWAWGGDNLETIERFRAVRLRVRDGVIYNISFPPGIEFSDVWLTYGKPSHGAWTIVNRLHSAGYRIEQELVYEDAGVYVSNRVECPASLPELWSAYSVVQLGEPVFFRVMEPVVRVSSGDSYNLQLLMRDQMACR